MKGSNIFVGLSGGVDSAVTAALLKKEGAHVTGVFIKGWYPPGMPCTWADDRRDAMRVAARLHIPFHTLDASKEYKKSVIDYLLSEYKSGRTPNPDIMCNRDVKFGAFYAFARNSGADAIATGHYAQTKNGSLYRGIDEGKDQSYFLWAVPKDVLSHALFPLGGMRKQDVRELAQSLKLPVADKRDSQGICFLGDISVEDFLREEFGEAVGNAVDEHGTIVGTHTGALLHTIGERIALIGADPGPWYVVRKDIQENLLVVSHSPHNLNEQNAITLESTNWLIETDPHATYEAQYRYHGPCITGTIQGNVFTPHSQCTESIAPGQSLVLYKDEQCIGGGIIA